MKVGGTSRLSRMGEVGELIDARAVSGCWSSHIGHETAIIRPPTERPRSLLRGRRSENGTLGPRVNHAIIPYPPTQRGRSRDAAPITAPSLGMRCQDHERCWGFRSRGRRRSGLGVGEGTESQRNKL